MSGVQDMTGFKKPYVSPMEQINQMLASPKTVDYLNTSPITTPGLVTGSMPLATMGTTPKPGMFSWDNMLGPNGWGGLALGAAQGLFGGYLGLQHLGLANKSFAENQRQFNMNYDSQRRLTNAQLEDRQRARLASNANAYQSIDTYMNQNGIK